jgi:pimeloyl-ACP methyl ester carboxylesterase
MSARAGDLWDRVESVLALEQPALDDAKVPISRRRRRAFQAEELDGRASLDLVRDADGILRWIYSPPARQALTGRRTYRALGIDEPEVVRRFRFHDLKPNQVTQGLQVLDARLTPHPGLKRWHEGAWHPVAPGALDGTGEVLLLVHGTFSHVRAFTDQLAATPDGQALLQRWQAHYGAILGFDHPTLSVGAWSNAVDLAQAIAGIRGPIDVVAHSRGGLVASWLLRLHQVPVRQAVFVGSPLTGTSLAAPDRLRAALDLLANVGEALAQAADGASAAMPLAAGAAGLARIFGRVLRLGSSLPVVDGAVVLVPGLAAQQRTSNNLELQQLFRAPWRTTTQLSAVRAAFHPAESDQGWRFWRRFTNIGDQLLYAGADLIFEGDNDLVVDVAAMAQLGEGSVLADVHDLGRSASTHHCNYFRDPAVLRFLRDRT